MNSVLKYIKIYWRELLTTLCITLTVIILAWNAPVRGESTPSKTIEYCAPEVMLVVVIFDGKSVTEMGQSAIGCRCLVTIDGVKYYTAQPMDPKHCNLAPDNTL